MPFFKFHFVEASRMAGIQYEGKELQSGYKRRSDARVNISCSS